MTKKDQHADESANEFIALIDRLAALCVETGADPRAYINAAAHELAARIGDRRNAGREALRRVPDGLAVACADRQ